MHAGTIHTCKHQFDLDVYAGSPLFDPEDNCQFPPFLDNIKHQIHKNITCRSQIL